MTGTVKLIVADRGFGFITPDSGVDCFFHVRDSDPRLPFDETIVGQRVEFNMVDAEKGPKATDVRLSA